LNYTEFILYAEVEIEADGFAILKVEHAENKEKPEQESSS
jgi:hypothetical protein